MHSSVWSLPARHVRLPAALAVAGVAAALAFAAGPAQAAPAGAAGGAGGAGRAAAAGAGHGAAGLTADAARWDRPRPSVHADPAALVAGVAARQHVRVVSVRAVDGRPAISVDEAVGPDAARSAVAAAEAAPGALGVDLDSLVHAEGTVTTVDDPYRAQQWGLTTLHAETTWSHDRADGTTVAVVDTGVDKSHPDLANGVLAGTDLVAVGGGDGSADGNGHGTHVAGIVAAQADNGIGVAGYARGARILPVRVLDSSGSGYDSTVAKGIVWAADHGADVVNLSLGGSSYSSVSDTAVAYALSRGVVVVAAAGNSRQTGNATSYPAAYAGVLAVAASDRNNASAPFSNTGPYVDLTAPGVGIWSTLPGSTYASWSGTSMATPFVSAAVALLLADAPSLTPDQVTAVLESTATDLGAVGRDDEFGYGLVNLEGALCPTSSCDGPVTPTVWPPVPVDVPSPPASPAPTPTPGETTPPPAAAPAPAPAPTTVPTAAPPALSAPVATTVRMLDRAGTLRYGGSVTGRVQVTSTGGVALAGQAVRVCAVTAPSPTPHCSNAWTDAGGTLRYALPARASTAVYAEHPASTGTAASRGATLTYRVVPVARVTTGRARLTVTLRPALPTRVALDRWTGSRWARGALRTTTARGSLSVGHLAPGRYRVRVPAAAGRAALTTAAVRVR